MYLPFGIFHLNNHIQQYEMISYNVWIDEQLVKMVSTWNMLYDYLIFQKMLFLDELK